MNESSSSRLLQIQLERNLGTRGDWETYATHREKVTNLLLRAAPKTDQASICILGAGNGNDLDLTRLSQLYRSITLVDIDSDALQHCLSRLPSGMTEKIHVLGGIDLSGLMDHLPRVSANLANEEAWQSALNAAGRPSGISSIGKFDVVASTCLLTQMIDTVSTSRAAQHPNLADLVLALRDGHLQLIDDLRADGGTALLITDVVSSNTLPELGTIDERVLPATLARALGEQNFFTGTNPAAISERLARHCRTGDERVMVSLPWRWQMGDRYFAVYAAALTR